MAPALAVTALACLLALPVVPGVSDAVEPAPAVIETPITRPAPPTVEQLIRQAAARHGISPAFMVALARCESGMGTHPRTYSGSAPYRGIFQWDRQSWAERAPLAGVARDWGAALNDWNNAEVTAHTLAAGQRRRWPNCPRAIHWY